MKLYELLKVIDLPTRCRIYQETKNEDVYIGEGCPEQLINRRLPICVLNKDVACVDVIRDMNGLAVKILLVK